jgi:TPR repeat protein
MKQASSMSDEEVEEADVCCANCGIVEVDDIKLDTSCNDCDLVKYCTDRCRKEHREQHDEECKNRVQELHDRKVFTQPDESHLGECPICFLPMPLVRKKITFYPCCCKTICDGCVYVNVVKNRNCNCPFCREPASADFDELGALKKRIKAGDPLALRRMGTIRYHEGDYDEAVEYFTKAAELGDLDAHNELGKLYAKGEGVEEDFGKMVYHYEKAAIGGHVKARHYLGCVEEGNGNIERAVKHFIIAANLGYEDSMKEVWDFFKSECIAKEDLEATLRTHMAAIDAIKSPERDAGEAWRDARMTG